MRLLLRLVALTVTLLLSVPAMATPDAPSPDGDAADAWQHAWPDAEPVPVDPHAFSNDIKSSVSALFTVGGVTLAFRPSAAGLTVQVSGRF